MMIHAQLIKEEKIMKKERECKGARTGSFTFSQQISDSGNCSQF